jgi:hypothetical protein
MRRTARRWGVGWLVLAWAGLASAAGLRVERVKPGEGPAQPPATADTGAQGGDLSLSPDGRFALWSEPGDGELYLAERVGPGRGPALRLPTPVNGPAAESRPAVSADGRWLYFASTRAADPAEAAVYRVSWPELLAALGPAATAHSQAALDQAVSRLWQAIAHAPGQPSDVATLQQLFHPQAQVFGQRLRASSLEVVAWPLARFLADMAQPSPRGLYECEVERQQRRFGGHAQVYSVVQTRHDPAQAAPAYTGVNSMQWQLGPHGWQLLSLHYALETPGLSLPPAGAPAACRG